MRDESIIGRNLWSDEIKAYLSELSSPALFLIVEGYQ